MKNPIAKIGQQNGQFASIRATIICVKASQLVRLAPDYAPAGENLYSLNRSFAKRNRLNASAENDDSLNSSAVDELPEIARTSGIWSK
jgi:hypothetical protein